MLGSALIPKRAVPERITTSTMGLSPGVQRDRSMMTDSFVYLLMTNVSHLPE